MITCEEKTTKKNRTYPTLEKLKEVNQDFEWYPTTDTMILAVARNCDKSQKILDVGAGDGRVLQKLYDLTEASGLYAIEKSEIHIQNMPPKISIVGTDFLLQSLIDKNVDVVFCNPPYSQFEDFATKIIREANAKDVFLILPERWKESRQIGEAIKARKATYRTIWKGDFLNAERAARAKVETLKISLETKTDYGRDKKSDPFDVWFESMFPEFDKIKEVKDEDCRPYEKPKFPHEIVQGQNLIERLHELYIKDMDNLYKNYHSLCGLDPVLLKELGVKHDEVKEGLKQKLAGTKNLYWQELFDHLDKVKQRLTKSSRNDMLEKMRSCCTMDYTADNAYAVVIWVIKNANEYIDNQLVDMFRELTEPDCIKNYKSNLKTWKKDGWRYNKKEYSHYTLDYRIVTQRHYAIETESWRSRHNNGLRDDCAYFLEDILTIANNLGFSNHDSVFNRNWIAGQSEDFYMSGGKILMNVRAYKNGNVHLKFNQDFIKTLNIEASRLLGWIKTPREAADEMGIDFDFCCKKFKTNHVFAPSDCKLLTA